MISSCGVEPQLIEGSSLVVIAIAEFEKLMIAAMDPPRFRHTPQYLVDECGTQTHVVLIESDFHALDTSQPISELLYYLRMPVKGVYARCQVYEDGTTAVLRGSTFGEEVSSLPTGWSHLRRDLLKRGIVAKQDDRYVFRVSYQFDSPSAAASVVTGDSKSGNDMWVDRNGETLGRRRRQS